MKHGTCDWKLRNFVVHQCWIPKAQTNLIPDQCKIFKNVESTTNARQKMLCSVAVPPLSPVDCESTELQIWLKLQLFMLLLYFCLNSSKDIRLYWYPGTFTGCSWRNIWIMYLLKVVGQVEPGGANSLVLPGVHWYSTMATLELKWSILLVWNCLLALSA